MVIVVLEMSFLGIDLMSLASIGSRFAGIDDVARKAKLAKGTLESFQESFSSLEKVL